MSKSIESLMAELKHANALLEQAQLRERAAAINTEAQLRERSAAKETKPKDKLGELDELISAIEAAVGSEMPAELRAELKEALGHHPKTSAPEAPAHCPQCGVSKEKYKEVLDAAHHWKDMFEGLVDSLEANGFAVTRVDIPLGMH